MLVFVVISVLCLFSSVGAVRPGDEIRVSSLPAGSNSFYIADEVYRFSLIPTYRVPMQVNRHVIYTATTSAIARLTLDSMTKKRAVISLAPEDYDIVSMLVGDVPSHVQADGQKRSVIISDNGVRRIDLGADTFLLVLEPIDTLKRVDPSSVPLGGKLCLAVPFFTSCDNSVDLEQVKATLKAQNEALRTELDSYKRTNDARDNELTKALNKQRDLVTAIATQSSNSLSLVQRLTVVERTNLVQTQHGDQIVHAQVNSLKRITNSLLRFANAIGSTDPRSVVAQPAMSKLFRGYQLLLSEFSKSTSPIKSPILDARTFNFTEKVLPDASVKNVTVIDLTTALPVQDLNNYFGFSVTVGYTCANLNIVTDSSGNRFCRTNNGAGPTIPTNGVEWMFGPFHTKHWGLYEVIDQTGLSTNSRESAIVVQEKAATQYFAANITYNSNPQCVNFLGFTVMASFQSTQHISNGIPAGTPPLPMSSCNNYRLFEAPGQTTKHYRMFSYTEGITVPFYSNCDRTQLQAVGLTLETGYLSGYPSVVTNSQPADEFINRQLYAKHWVSPTCYINIEPEWIGLSYYINMEPTVVSNIPRGYKFNQFTLNPVGELASSLEFVYTPNWAWIYTVLRTQRDQNRVIVDEVDVLDGSKVLFVKSATSIIDESDSMFGEGNNGRDCIQVPKGSEPNNMNYEYDLTDCFFQNDQTGYPIQMYLNGLVKTTGISRFNSKFAITLAETTIDQIPAYTFEMKPRAEADFRFYVVTSADTCPHIISRSVSKTGCSFDFAYSGTEQVLINGNTITFTNGTATKYTVPSSSDPYRITVGTRDCLVVTCRKTLNSTYVQLDTPAFEVVSKADKDMATAVGSSLNELMSGALAELTRVDSEVQTAKDNIDKLIGLFNSIDFNMSKLFPYKNFSDLRAQVDRVTDQIGKNYCSSPFQSVDCWLKDFGSTLIAVGAVLVVGIAVVLFCFKTQAGNKLRAKLCGGAGYTPSSETPSGIAENGYGAPKKSKKPKDQPGDFQLLATN